MIPAQLSHRRSIVATTSFCLLMLLIASGAVSAEEPTRVGTSWVPEGPGPMEDGQVEGATITDQEVSGAINTVAAHPANADILYAGGVNGGIWKTTDATAPSPTWTQQIPTHSSQSIATIDFDPTDGTSQTLVAGVGRFSSFSGNGGARTGILRTTNGGATWTAIGGDIAGKNVVALAARGATLVAGVDVADNFTCSNIGIWRSTDTGATWAQITAGIPRGAVDALAGDPSSTSTLYASLVFGPFCDADVNGIYKSTDTGATWSKVSDAPMDALLTDSAAVNVDISVGTSSNVYVAIIPISGALGGIFRSGNGGGTWTAMDLPGTMELPGPAFVGVHAGSQGGTHSCLIADPTDANIVYIGGDRQPAGFMDMGGFPNSIGANDFSGRLFRGDASLAPGSQFTPLTHSGTASSSAPHADSRDLAFDAAGNLIETDDGGIYKRTAPKLGTGDWFSLNGDIQVTEAHNLAYDANSDILQIGNQDTGTAHQITPGGTRWDSIHTGDGGDTIIDSISTPGMSIRYSSFQGLAGFRRRTYDASNTFVSQVFPPLTVLGGGADLATQFVTPLALNAFDPLRIVIGGGNSVYESLDQGDSITEVGPGIVAMGFGRDAIVAGGGGNAEALYVGGCIGSCSAGGDDGVFVRTVGAGPLSLSLPSGADIVQGVAGNPGDAAEAFTLLSSGVHHTLNTGGSWSDITGNLTSLDTGVLRSIEFVTNGSDDGVVVGTDKGVFVAYGPSFTTWQALGTGLPNTPVYELDWDEASETLYAGTLGRSTFSLDDAFSGQGLIFADGFESGNTSLWSNSVP